MTRTCLSAGQRVVHFLRLWIDPWFLGCLLLALGLHALVLGLCLRPTTLSVATFDGPRVTRLQRVPELWARVANQGREREVEAAAADRRLAWYLVSRGILQPLTAGVGSGLVVRPAQSCPYHQRRPAAASISRGSTL